MPATAALHRTLTILGSDCERRGKMVAPECPPTTGIVYLGASAALPTTVATKVEARTMSRCETPSSLSSAQHVCLTTNSGPRSDARFLNTPRADLPLGVVHAGLLQRLGEDGNGRVDGVGDDEDEGLGAGVGDGLGEGRADAGVNFLVVSDSPVRRSSPTRNVTLRCYQADERG